jgi:hypothetical protein
MFYNGFTVHGEVIMGEVHVTVRARRFDDSTGHAWDHLYRGVVVLDDSLGDLDAIYLPLLQLVRDLEDYGPGRDNTRRGSHESPGAVEWG